MGRLPVFDYLNLNGIGYMRFKVDIVFAQSDKGPVFIIPTDDQRIKFVITPYRAGSDFITQVQNNIATMSEIKATSNMELLVPTFKVEALNQGQCVGHKMDGEPATEDKKQVPVKWVSSSEASATVELCAAKAAAASISAKVSKDAEVISDDFLFGKFVSGSDLFCSYDRRRNRR